MAVEQTRAQAQAEVALLIPDNITRLISPLKTRTVWDNASESAAYKKDTDTISAVWQFAALPQTAVAPTVANDLVNKSYADSLVTDRVVGAASSIDNSLPKFDGTTGKVIQTTGIIIDDSNNVSGVNDLTVNGNVIINGNTIQINSEISTSDAVIDMNDGEVGSGVTLGYAGLNIDRGSANNYWLGFDEVRDGFSIGEITALSAPQIATTQLVATREDSPTDNALTTWDSATGKLITSSTLTYVDGATSTLSMNADTDSTTILGNTRIHSYTTGIAHFSHNAMTTNLNYALRQNSSGLTQLNSASGQQLILKNNNNTQWTMDSSGNLVGSAGNTLTVDGQIDSSGDIISTATSSTQQRVKAVNAVDGISSYAAFRSESLVASAQVASHATARTVTRYGIALGDYSEIVTSEGNGLLIGTTNNAHVVFGTNDTKALEIDSSQNAIFSGQVKLPNGSTAAPSLCWGTDAGFSYAGSTLYFNTLGSNRFFISSVGTIASTTSTRFQINNTTATATSPVFIHNKSSSNTGLGGIAGELSLITNGVEAVNIDASRNVTINGPSFLATSSNSFRLNNETATRTNPTICPSSSRNSTGLGGQVNQNYLSLITGAVEAIFIDDNQDVSIQAGNLAVNGTVTGTSFNGVALTTGGSAGDYLDATGNYVTVAGGSAGIANKLNVSDGAGNFVETRLSVHPTNGSISSTLSGIYFEQIPAPFVAGATDLGFSSRRWNNLYLETGINFSSGGTIVNLADPTNPQDVATMNYVDTEIATALSGGNVTKVGTPANNQVAVWTGDGTIEGTSAFAYTIGTLTLTDADIDLTAARNIEWGGGTHGLIFGANNGMTFRGGTGGLTIQDSTGGSTRALMSDAGTWDYQANELTNISNIESSQFTLLTGASNRLIIDYTTNQVDITSQAGADLNLTSSGNMNFDFSAAGKDLIMTGASAVLTFDLDEVSASTARVINNLTRSGGGDVDYRFRINGTDEYVIDKTGNWDYQGNDLDAINNVRVAPTVASTNYLMLGFNNGETTNRSIMGQLSTSNTTEHILSLIANANNISSDSGTVPTMALISERTGGATLSTRPTLAGYNYTTKQWEVSANGDWDYQGNSQSGITDITGQTGLLTIGSSAGLDLQYNGTTELSVESGLIEVQNDLSVLGTISTLKGNYGATSADPEDTDIISSSDLAANATYLCHLNQSSAVVYHTAIVMTNSSKVLNIVELANSGSSIMTWTNNSGALAITKTGGGTPTIRYTVLRLR